jgi:hypothetical protein
MNAVHTLVSYNNSVLIVFSYLQVSAEILPGFAAVVSDVNGRWA